MDEKSDKMRTDRQGVVLVSQRLGGLLDGQRRVVG